MISSCHKSFTTRCHKFYLLQVVDPSKGIDEVPVWFEGSRLNFAENLLRYRDDRVALFAAGILVTHQCEKYIFCLGIKCDFLTVIFKYFILCFITRAHFQFFSNLFFRAFQS